MIVHWYKLTIHYKLYTFGSSTNKISTLKYVHTKHIKNTNLISHFLTMFQYYYCQKKTVATNNQWPIKTQKIGKKWNIIISNFGRIFPNHINYSILFWGGEAWTKSTKAVKTWQQSPGTHSYPWNKQTNKHEMNGTQIIYFSLPCLACKLHIPNHISYSILFWGGEAWTKPTKGVKTWIILWFSQNIWTLFLFPLPVNSIPRII